MAHFRGTIQGARGEASRLGSKKSGLRMQANGWNIGAEVLLQYDEETNKDELVVQITDGSAHRRPTRILKIMTEDEVQDFLKRKD